MVVLGTYGYSVELAAVVTVGAGQTPSLASRKLVHLRSFLLDTLEGQPVPLRTTCMHGRWVMRAGR